MYYDDIDPIGEERDNNKCKHCDSASSTTYCSEWCKQYDLE